MLNLNELHRFYEANVPGYLRCDILRISKFFLSEMALPNRKPYKQIDTNFKGFKEFVAFDWFGWEEIGTKKMIELVPAGTKPTGGKKRKREFGRCKCGGFMVKRQNREERTYFLGCSTWPKCKNTKPLLD